LWFKRARVISFAYKNLQFEQVLADSSLLYAVEVQGATEGGRAYFQEGTLLQWCLLSVQLLGCCTGGTLFMSWPSSQHSGWIPKREGERNGEREGRTEILPLFLSYRSPVASLLP
jgi:hypothetical protein